jgi:23S rRNA A2030 N6-methylase RlmJ
VNYRHVFHAGNFADVLKHAMLCRVLMYLREKPAAFRVIDTHAGAGLYDLTSSEAARGAEWPLGIGRLFEADLPPNIAELLAPRTSQNCSRLISTPCARSIRPASCAATQAHRPLPRLCCAARTG